MLDDIAFVLLAIVVLVIAALARPTMSVCPRGWFVEGVRPTGETRCIRPDTTKRIPVQVYCTRGTVPIAIGDDTVACTRRPGS
jgi:hypothetical protein